MKSWTLVEFGKPFEEREVETPEPTGTEVLLKVRRCGVCHSDVHISHGYFDYGDGNRFNLVDRGMKLPLTLGHEVLGEIVKAGPDAPPVEVGRTMLVNPWIGCGKCDACREERDNDCTGMRALGVVRNGGYATHIIVDQPRFLVDVEGLDPFEATPYSCSGVTVYSGLKKALPIRDGEWLAVLGAGGLGLAAVSIAKAMGAGKVVSVDLDDAKLEAAKGMGADATLNLKTVNDGVSALQEITGGELLAVLDTVGMESTSKLGIMSLKKTGRYVVVGLHGGALHMPLPLLPQRALTVRGSYVGSTTDLEELIALAKAGKVRAAPIEERPMSAASDTLAQLEKGEIVGRVVLTTE
jgi:D-arabinose 1-dehydrogenase-like Zn-dependent alcohol dehydrogenase